MLRRLVLVAPRTVPDVLRSSNRRHGTAFKYDKYMQQVSSEVKIIRSEVVRPEKALLPSNMRPDS